MKYHLQKPTEIQSLIEGVLATARTSLCGEIVVDMAVGYGGDTPDWRQGSVENPKKDLYKIIADG